MLFTVWLRLHQSGLCLQQLWRDMFDALRPLASSYGSNELLTTDDIQKLRMRRSCPVSKEEAESQYGLYRHTRVVEFKCEILAFCATKISGQLNAQIGSCMY